MIIKIPSLQTVDDCIAFAQTINPKKEPLTIEKLRRFPGCEKYSDEEAAQIIETIDLLTNILFDNTSMQHGTCSKQVEVVSLEDTTQLYPTIKNKVA